MNDKHIFSIRPLAVALMAMGSLPVMAVPPAVPTSGAYTTDATQSYVEDATSQGIRLPNTVLCYMNGTGANQSTVLNQTTYIALVDKNKCENASGAVNNSASGNSGATSAPDYMTGVITATRVDDASPLIGKVFFLENAMHQRQNTTTGIIYAKLTATAAPIAGVEPYGHFHTDFCGLPGGTGTCTTDAPFYGYAEGNGATVSAFQAGTDQHVAVTMTGDVDIGHGRVQFSQQNSPGGDWAFAFNTSYFLRANNDGSNQTCFDRRASQAEKTAWSYGVYDINGARLQRNSGFPIKTQAGDMGYVGYWGMWLPPTAQVTTGATVTRFSYGNSSPTTGTYTLVKTNGRLKKLVLQHTKLGGVNNGTPVNGIVNVPFYMWVSQQFQDSDSNVRNVGDNLEVKWDGSSLLITGTMSNGQVTPDQSCAPTCANIPTAALQTMWNLGGWSQSLGGQVNITIRDATGGFVALSPTTDVTYRTEAVLTPGDTRPGADWGSDLTLYCVTGCPAGGSTFTSGLNSGNPYQNITTNSGPVSSQWNWMIVPVANAIQFTANKTTGMLNTATAGGDVDGTAVTLTNQFSNGFQSGRMVDGTGLQALLCDASNAADPAGTYYCPNLLDSVDTVYVWETGPNSWNNFTGLTDPANGQFVLFDPPKLLTYAVPSDVSSAYAGANLALQYNGFGDLQGIPGKCVDPATNAEMTTCGPDTRWVAAFTIPADSTVSDGGTNTYFVKPLQEELRLRQAANGLSDCSGLTLPANFMLPDGTLWVDPHVANGTYSSSMMPTTAPRVIDGVVQY